MSALSMVKADDRWWTAEDAAAYAQVSVRTIYRDVAAGKLKAAKVGSRRCFRFRPAWVEQWLEHAAQPQELQAKSA